MNSHLDTLLESCDHLATAEVIFRRVLVAIDFSAETHRIVKTAIAIAAAFDSELFLANATSPLIVGTGLEPVALDTYMLNREIAETRMSELVANEPAFKCIRHRKIVAYATLIELMQEVVRDESVDLVIAGSHGAKGLERMILGSASESIVRRLSCPVMVVGPNATSSISPFRSVLLASSLKLSELRAAQYASALAERFHGKLTVLHVCSGPSCAAKAEAERALASLMPSDLETYSRGAVRIETGSADVLVPEVARRECVSLIVCGVSDSAFWGSHTPGSTLAAVIREAHCPVLCVRHHSN